MPLVGALLSLVGRCNQFDCHFCSGLQVRLNAGRADAMVEALLRLVGRCDFCFLCLEG